MFSFPYDEVIPQADLGKLLVLTDLESSMVLPKSIIQLPLVPYVH
jgi:hypothetical protein